MMVMVMRTAMDFHTRMGIRTVTVTVTVTVRDMGTRTGLRYQRETKHPHFRGRICLPPQPQMLLRCFMATVTIMTMIMTMVTLIFIPIRTRCHKRGYSRAHSQQPVRWSIETIIIGGSICMSLPTR